MTKAGFTYDGVDPGDSALGNVMLVGKRVELVPQIRDRIVAAGARPGIWDFGSELGARTIELAVVSGDNADVAGTDAAVRQLADLFDPTRDTVAGDKGYRQLIFDTESDRYWLAKLVDGPAPEYLPSAGKLRLTMRCSDPLAYSTALYTIDGGAATITGFNAYRQAPEKFGTIDPTRGWNLVKNGGLIAAVGSEWTLDGAASRVVDATSVTGFAIRSVRAALGLIANQSFPVEAGKAYSAAMQARADGVTNLTIYLQWLDASGTFISQDLASSSTSVAWQEIAVTNKVAPGNARTCQIHVEINAAGIGFVTAFRFFQQVAAAAAWVAAHQQTLTQKGLAIYEASTNLAADGDMEAVGTASYTAVTSTLAKDTGTFFMGAKSLKVTSTGADGRAEQTGALAAGQAITASLRVKGGDATCRLRLVSTPSATLIGSVNNPNTTDWNTLRVSGVIAGGDTGWQAILVAGANTVVAYFDNFAVENKAYDTMNADPSGQTFALAARTVSNDTIPTPAGFDLADFAAIGVVRLDHAYNHGFFERMFLDLFVDVPNYIRIEILPSGSFIIDKHRAGVVTTASDATVTASAAGDTLAWAMKISPVDGVTLFVSKNGGAVATYNVATPEALLPVPGTPTMNLGRYGGGAGFELDGTLGVVRILRPGQTNATISARVLNPYVAQDETYELAVWRFEGAAVPEDYASGVLSLEVGGTYWTDPSVELVAGGAYTGNVTFTDSLGNVLTWNGTLALNDVLRVESDVVRVRKNGALAMSGVVAGSKWPRLRGGGLRDSITVGGIASANVKALRAIYRHRWI